MHIYIYIYTIYIYMMIFYHLYFLKRFVWWFQGKNDESDSSRFPESSKKTKSNNDDKHDHVQENRRPSTYVEGENNNKN